MSTLYTAYNNEKLFGNNIHLIIFMLGYPQETVYTNFVLALYICGKLIRCISKSYYSCTANFIINEQRYTLIQYIQNKNNLTP
jgi:hypothetical protein